MTNEQKKGIEILNRLARTILPGGDPALSDDEYYFLLDFIVGSHGEIQNIPVPCPWQNPVTPWTTDPFYVTHQYFSTGTQSTNTRKAE